MDIITIVLLAVLCIFVIIPLCIIGILSLMKLLDRMSKVRAGYVLGRFVLPSGSEIEKFVRPVDNRIKTKIGKEEKEFMMTENSLTYNKNIPIATFREDNIEQINYRAKRWKPEIHSSTLNNLFKRFYMLGKNSVSQKDMVTILLYIAIGLCVVSVGIGLFNTSILQRM